MAGLLMLPDKVPAAEWLPQIWGPRGRVGCVTDRFVDHPWALCATAGIAKSTDTTESI